MAGLFHARLSASAISAILPSFGLCATIARLCAFMKGRQVCELRIVANGNQRQVSEQVTIRGILQRAVGRLEFRVWTLRVEVLDRVAKSEPEVRVRGRGCQQIVDVGEHDAADIEPPGRLSTLGELTTDLFACVPAETVAEQHHTFFWTACVDGAQDEGDPVHRPRRRVRHA